MKVRTKTRLGPPKPACPATSAVVKRRRLSRPKDLAAFLLGLLCLFAAGFIALHLLVGLEVGFILVAGPVTLIALAVLALLALKH